MSTPEDAKILRFAGLMGHHFVGVAGAVGARRLVMEANDPRNITSAMEGLKTLTVYQRRGSDWEKHS